MDAAQSVPQSIQNVSESVLHDAWAVAQDWTPWLIAALVALIAGWVVCRFAWGLARRAWRKDDGSPADGVRSASRYAGRASVITAQMLALRMVVPFAPEGPPRDAILHIIVIGIVIGISWMVIALIEAFEEVVAAKYSIDVEDNLHQRKIQTQTRVLVRSVQIIVGIVGAAAVLMTFPAIRQFGASILASAGLAGLVVGLAARPVVANLIAGVQIALTQPIRIDDVVVMEGQWGRIEEITSTYVVVKIWDERRLIVPLSRIIEQPFENWTRTSAALMGTVTIRTDLGVDLDGVRAELKRLCEASSKWDKRVSMVQVTAADERSMEVRALVSARNSGNLWDLRCDVREGLLRHLQDHNAGALPMVRAAVHPVPRVHPDGPSGEQQSA